MDKGSPSELLLQLSLPPTRWASSAIMRGLGLVTCLTYVTYFLIQSLPYVGGPESMNWVGISIFTFPVLCLAFSLTRRGKKEFKFRDWPVTIEVRTSAFTISYPAVWGRKTKSWLISAKTHVKVRKASLLFPSNRIELLFGEGWQGLTTISAMLPASISIDELATQLNQALKKATTASLPGPVLNVSPAPDPPPA